MREYFGSFSAGDLKILWPLVDEAGDWFARRSLEVLGPFTERVDLYLATAKIRATGEDALFCSSPRLEYHLNMVGSEILNQILRPSFLSSEQKIVVLPACLRENPANCGATPWRLGLLCSGCTPECQVAKVSKR